MPEEEPVEAVEAVEPVEAFDLDSAVEDFSSNAPEEWSAKAKKIYSEVKGLREDRNRYRDAYDGLDDATIEGLLSVAKAYKNPAQHPELARWFVGSAKNLAGESFKDIMGEFTPQQQAEAKEAVADAIEDATEDADRPLTQSEVAALVKETLEAERAKAADEEKNAAQLREINSELDKLGHEDALERKFVVQIAMERTDGDLEKASAEWKKQVATYAKNYLQSKDADPNLLDQTAGASSKSDDSLDHLDPLERARVRMGRRLDEVQKQGA